MRDDDDENDNGDVDDDFDDDCFPRRNKPRGAEQYASIPLACHVGDHFPTCPGH